MQLQRLELILVLIVSLMQTVINAPTQTLAQNALQMMQNTILLTTQLYRLRQLLMVIMFHLDNVHLLLIAMRLKQSMFIHQPVKVLAVTRKKNVKKLLDILMRRPRIMSVKLALIADPVPSQQLAARLVFSPRF